MKRHRPLFLCLTATVLLCFGSTYAQQSAPNFNELEKVAIDELHQQNTPGAAIGIVSGDRLIYVKGIGMSDIETGTPLAPEMLFRVGSTTKMFTATALVSLAEEGKIKLDDPIGLVVKGLDPKIAAVTAHQLLTHTSGFLDEAPMYGSQDEDALENEVKSWREDSFFTTPGDIYSYSNPGYWLAGFIVQDLSGKLYADAMNDRIFAPLGMTRTTLRLTVAMTYPLAQGHDASPGRAPTVVRPFANNTASWPAGSIFSNVQDLSRFVIAFMNDGKIDTKQVISPAVIKSLTTPHISVPGTQEVHYGYGLELLEERGVHMVRHAGSRSGYGSLIWMVPDYRFAVIILANRTGANLSQTAEKAMEMMLPLGPKAPAEAEKDLPISDADKAAWVGTYVQPPGQELEIVLKDGRLFLRRGTSELPIRKTGENRISVAPPGASRGQQFFIVRGKDGKTLYLYAGGRAARKI
jgi:CubicO group peptidase (beta-lactamase class C family)